MEEFLADIEKALGKLYESGDSYFVGTMQLEVGDKSTFNGASAKRDSSMADVCCSVIQDYQDQLGDAAGVEFGGFLGKTGRINMNRDPNGGVLNMSIDISRDQDGNIVIGGDLTYKEITL